MCLPADVHTHMLMHGVACNVAMMTGAYVTMSRPPLTSGFLSFVWVKLVLQIPFWYWHTHLASFVLLSCTLLLHLCLSFSASLSLIAFLSSCCNGGLVCIEANPLTLNVSHQPLRPHGFLRRLPVVVCVLWHLCVCVKRETESGSYTNGVCLFCVSVL